MLKKYHSHGFDEINLVNLNGNIMLGSAMCKIQNPLLVLLIFNLWYGCDNHDDKQSPKSRVSAATIQVSVIAKRRAWNTGPQAQIIKHRAGQVLALT